MTAGPLTLDVVMIKKNSQQGRLDFCLILMERLFVSSLKKVVKRKVLLIMMMMIARILRMMKMQERC